LREGIFASSSGSRDHEIDPQPVDEPCALGHERVTVIAQQADLGCLFVEERGGEALDPLA
jgi:hypothetical protein